ncbi:hypothetical protein KC333_g6174 [Hortaea werneckii]|nr:hypothetical protein KC333_g6174 [Hortaea werneckii]KAI7311842.1 hypothetical protein KC326_g6127 [Hortaea werneckii]
MHGLRLTRGTQDILEQCEYYVLDDSEIFVFSCSGEEKQVRIKCTNAEESYARQVLGWPKGRLAKPSIFRESTTRPGNIQACVTQFVHHIGQLLERKAHEDSNELEVYPFAFVVFDHDDPSSQVTVMVALKGEDDQWSLESCRIPLEVQLGQKLDSLRMGDISEQDLVSSYGISSPPATAQQPRSSSSQTSSQDHWSFAIFSTGLPNALSLPAWIDARTDSVHPTKASVDLIGNPKDSRYQMKWEYVKALFPIACRDTKKADGIKMHRHIFICCDNDDPQSEGLLLINVDWDENVDRSDEELKAVGEQLEHTETRVQLSECLQKARDMASA